MKELRQNSQNSLCQRRTSQSKAKTKDWIDFVKRKRTKWEPTEHSEICSKHFNECDFISRYVGEHNIPGAESKLQVRPRLKQDEIGVCVVPSIISLEEEHEKMLLKRDSRRIVSVFVFFFNCVKCYDFYVVKLMVQTIHSVYNLY